MHLTSEPQSGTDTDLDNLPETGHDAITPSELALANACIRTAICAVPVLFLAALLGLPGVPACGAVMVIFVIAALFFAKRGCAFVLTPTKIGFTTKS